MLPLHQCIADQAASGIRTRPVFFSESYNMIAEKNLNGQKHIASGTQLHPNYVCQRVALPRTGSVYPLKDTFSAKKHLLYCVFYQFIVPQPHDAIATTSPHCSVPPLLTERPE